MTISKQFSSEHHALLRGWIQGVDWHVLGEMCSSVANRSETQAIVKLLRSQLAIKARRLNLITHEAIWSQERGYTADWIDLALKSLETLSSLAPTPQPDSLVTVWFMAKIASRLEEASIKSLSDLNTFINERGHDWWQGLPNFGLKSAKIVEALFEDYAHDLNLTLDLSKKVVIENTSIIRTSEIAPFERFLPPELLDGSSGSNRAPMDRCKVEANNDYEAIQAWLSLWISSNQTFRAYRKEAERFLLWAIMTKYKSFSSVTTVDCAEYLRFLTDPAPESSWISSTSSRSSTQWRPFKGPLKPVSVRHAKVILSSLCDWLVGQRYLDSNPFAGLAYENYPKRNSAIEKVLSPALWEKVLGFAEQQAMNQEHEPNQHRYYQRIRFVLMLAYRTGLRLEELANATVGHVKRLSSDDQEQYWLDVEGKGKKYREVPVPPILIEQLNRHLGERHLSSLEYVSPDTFLIGKIRGDMKEGVSVSALARTLKDFFIEAAGVLGKDDPAIASRLKKASTHWLRHSHASHAVTRGVPLAIVRDNLGHSDISTTSIYVHTERDDRYKAMTEKM